MNALSQTAVRVAAPVIVNLVQDMITRENFERYGDKLFDLIEDYVRDSGNTIDDTIVLPLVQSARAALNIPDNE